MENSTEKARSWSDLQTDLLLEVVNLIDPHIDLPRVRAVCRSWRSGIPPPLNLPSCFITVPNIPGYSKACNLEEVGLFLITPYHANGKPWLTRMINVKPRIWKLANPCCCHRRPSSCSANDLIYFKSKPPIRGEINLLDCNVVQVAKGWLVNFHSEEAKRITTVSHKVGSNAFLVKLYPNYGGYLLFKRSCDEDWFRIKSSDEYRLGDIAYYKGIFYVFELVNWKVGVIDPLNHLFSLELLEFMAAPGVIDGDRLVVIDGIVYSLIAVYLVPCKEHLYLVIESNKAACRENMLLVFVLKEGNEKDHAGWERVSNLGDQCLFIGIYVSFGVSNLPNWNPSSICFLFNPDLKDYFGVGYFNDFYMPPPKWAVGFESFIFQPFWNRLTMYNMEEEEKGIVEFSKLSQEKYTGLFFPPPAWVRWRRDNVEVLLDNINMDTEVLCPVSPAFSLEWPTVWPACCRH